MPPVITATVLVLSKPSCVQCNATYRELDKHGLDYEVRDMSVDPDLLEYAKSLGYLSAPVVIIEGDHWSGFRPDKIGEIAAKM